MTEEEKEQRPEVVAGPTNSGAASRTGDTDGPEGRPDPRSMRQPPGQKGYGPGGPQIGATDEPLTEADIAALDEALAQLRELRQGMENK